MNTVSHWKDKSGKIVAVLYERISGRRYQINAIHPNVLVEQLYCTRKEALNTFDLYNPSRL